MGKFGQKYLLAPTLNLKKFLKFYSFGHGAWHGQGFLHQGLNPHPLQGKHGVLTHWPAKEVPIVMLL